MFGLTTYVVILGILFPLITSDDPCRFQNGGRTIDLTSVGRPGSAAFPDRSPQQGSLDFKYSYNPCQSFSEGLTCIDVAACQVSNDGQHTYILGKQDSAHWDAGDGIKNPSITYQFNEKKVIVDLQCTGDSSHDMQVINEDPQNQYNFRLTGKCACWNGDGCSGGPTVPPITTTTSKGGGGGGSGGDSPIGIIFLGALVGVLVAYFLVFAVIYRFVYHRTGAELIAHRQFWASVPGYAKDGTVFTYRKITRKGGDNYQSV